MGRGHKEESRTIRNIQSGMKASRRQREKRILDVVQARGGKQITSKELKHIKESMPKIVGGFRTK